MAQDSETKGSAGRSTHVLNTSYESNVGDSTRKRRPEEWTHRRVALLTWEHWLTDVWKSDPLLRAGHLHPGLSVLFSLKEIIVCLCACAPACMHVHVRVCMSVPQRR